MTTCMYVHNETGLSGGAVFFFIINAQVSCTTCNGVLSWLLRKRDLNLKGLPVYGLVCCKKIDQNGELGTS